MTTLAGGCLCKAIRYTAEAAPLMALRCFCRDCQYVSGGEPAAVAVLPSDAVVVTRGEPRRHWSTADSGARVWRDFCPDCGTPLFAGNAAHPGATAVKLGSLDDPAAAPPTGAIWTASRQPWHTVDPAQPAFPQNPQF